MTRYSVSTRLLKSSERYAVLPVNGNKAMSQDPHSIDEAMVIWHIWFKLITYEAEVVPQYTIVHKAAETEASTLTQ